MILTLQNGLGNVELLGELFGLDRIMAGLCFVCINRLSPGVISHTASGLIRIAWANKAMDAFSSELLSSFGEANIRCEGVENLEKALIFKFRLLFNYWGNFKTLNYSGKIIYKKNYRKRE